MRRKTCRVLSFILVLVLCSGIPAMAVDARTNEYIEDGSTSIVANGDGSITVSFYVTGTGRMTKIGASTIYIKNSSGTTVKTYSYPTYSNLQGSNRMSYSSSVTYSGSSGSYYYAVVVLYASNSNGSGTLQMTTSSVKA